MRVHWKEVNDMCKVCIKNFYGCINKRGGFWFSNAEKAVTTMTAWGFKREQYVIIEEKRGE